MSSRRCLVACLLLLAAHDALAAWWTFGEDYPEHKTVSGDIGEIGPTQSVKVIKLKVPRCYSLSYVSVQVVNNHAQPEVTYDEDTYTVTIQYQPGQSSASTYAVAAKGSRILCCKDSGEEEEVQEKGGEEGWGQEEDAEEEGQQEEEQNEQ
ncbi:uncharacterized protein LOC142984259 [Anticarsia gemmatalis]|uniref:uncharacterized protein LOC142984259 n=1 Tax=Anticarsia gemmatalis TaxID=129554 RepID=UPI003F775A6F